MVELSTRRTSRPSLRAAVAELCSNLLVGGTAVLLFALVEGSVFLDGKAAAERELRDRNEALERENSQLRAALRHASAPLSSSVRGAPAREGKFLLAISSLGGVARRYHTILANLRTHFSAPAWDCVLYSHVPFPTSEARTSAPALAIRDRCRIVECLGCGVANGWNLTTPALVAPYEFVFILLDHTVLPRAAFSLSALLAVARRKRLDVASPAVLGATHAFAMAPDRCTACAAGRCKAAACRLPHAAAVARLNRGCVRHVDLIEVHAALYTRAAWRCVWSMFSHEVLGPKRPRALPWGYEACFAAHCPLYARQAVVLSQLAVRDSFPNKASRQPFVAEAMTQARLIELWVERHDDGRRCFDLHNVTLNKWQPYMRAKSCSSS
ncbi:hypothetical protein AB1Y20_007647 [Prymnesium parvum]|uniref:Uncharacterized protein n=1 Tax=Prymnesium parvum TaxID=97485 RepID=A0AB34IVM0_PRYPA